MYLLLRPIFCQPHPNFINVRTAYASEIWVQLTKISSQNQIQKNTERTYGEHDRRINMNKELLEAMEVLEKEKNISKDTMIEGN